MVDLADVVGQIFGEPLRVSIQRVALQNDEMLAEIVPHAPCFFGVFDHILIIRLLHLKLTGRLLQLLLCFEPFLFSGENLKKYKGSRYYSIIAAPIYIEEKMEAVIVLASFNKEQQKILIEKKELLLRYIENLTDLIASKYKEKELLE